MTRAVTVVKRRYMNNENLINRTWQLSTWRERRRGKISCGKLCPGMLPNWVKLFAHSHWKAKHQSTGLLQRKVLLQDDRARRWEASSNLPLAQMGCRIYQVYAYSAGASIMNKTGEGFSYVPVEQNIHCMFKKWWLNLAQRQRFYYGSEGKVTRGHLKLFLHKSPVQSVCSQLQPPIAPWIPTVLGEKKSLADFVTIIHFGVLSLEFQWQLTSPPSKPSNSFLPTSVLCVFHQ